MERLTTKQFTRWWAQTGEHELRQILLWRWDPLGVSDCFPITAHEYDGYVPQIAGLLRDGVAESALAQHLAGVEQEAMGTSASPPDCLDGVSASLVRWYVTSTDSWMSSGPMRC